MFKMSILMDTYWSGFSLNYYEWPPKHIRFNSIVYWVEHQERVDNTFALVHFTLITEISVYILLIHTCWRDLRPHSTINFLMYISFVVFWKIFFIFFQCKFVLRCIVYVSIYVQSCMLPNVSPKSNPVFLYIWMC